MVLLDLDGKLPYFLMKKINLDRPDSFCHNWYDLEKIILFSERQFGGDSMMVVDRFYSHWNNTDSVHSRSLEFRIMLAKSLLPDAPFITDW